MRSGFLPPPERAEVASTLNDHIPAVGASVAAGSREAGSTGRGGASHRRRWTAAGLAAALVTGGLAAALWLQRGDGGFSVARPTLGYTLPVMEPGDTSFFLGAMRLQHPGEDLEIVDVEVITSPNVEYLGAFTVWPRDYPTNKHSVGLGYPPPQLEDRHPALDTPIPAAETAFMPSGWGQNFPPPVVVNAGFRITSGDVGALNGVRVTYRIGGKTTHKDFRYFVIACVKPNPCDSPDGEEDYEDVLLREFGLAPAE